MDSKSYKDKIEESMKWWKVTITKKSGKLFKGQNVEVKAKSLSDAIKKGLKQMKANPALVPSDAVDAELAESIEETIEESSPKGKDWLVLNLDTKKTQYFKKYDDASKHAKKKGGLVMTATHYADNKSLYESDDLENTTPDITERAKNFLTKEVTEGNESDELEENKYTELGLTVEHNLNMAQTFWWKLNKGLPKSLRRTFVAMLVAYIKKNKATYTKALQPNPSFPSMYTVTFKDKSNFQAWVPEMESKVKDIQVANADYLAINGTRGNMFHKAIKANDLKLKLKEDHSPINESTPVDEVELEEATDIWSKEGLTLTRFSGGKDLGVLFQLSQERSIGNKKYSSSHIVLTADQVKGLFGTKIRGADYKGD